MNKNSPSPDEEVFSSSNNKKDAFMNADLQHDLDEIKEKAREIRAVLAHAVQDVKEKATFMLQQSAEDMKSKANNVEENVAAYVRKNPLKSMGYAVLAGVVLTKLLL